MKNKINICLNRNIINKANMDDRKQKYSFTHQWVRENYTPQQVFDSIAVKGYSFCNAVLKNMEDGYYHKISSNWSGNQILALDFDNTDSTGKKFVGSNYFSYDEATKEPYFLRHAAFIYTTPNHTFEHNRFRVVFFLSNVLKDQDKYKKAIQYLTKKFNADPATTSIVQGFYGCRNSDRSCFWNNYLHFDDIDELVQEYDLTNTTKTQSNIKYDLEDWRIEDYEELCSFIFKKGKIDNSDWWKVPTILSAYCQLSEDVILNLISKYIEIGDAKSKIRNASKYIGKMTLGTLIWIAQKNGYQISKNHIHNKDYKFWVLTPRVNREGNIYDYKINTDDYKYQLFLESKGFYNYIASGIPELVRVVDNKIFHSSDLEIRNLTLDYLETDDLYNTPREANFIKSKIRKDSTRLITNTIRNLPVLDNKSNFKIARDTKNSCYLFYENGIRVITKDKQEFLSYSKFNGYVQEERILNRPYTSSDLKTSSVEKFVQKLATTRLINGELSFDEQKFDSLVSIIGYLSSNYKCEDDSVAIIITDSNVTSSDENEGGTGKSLFAKILSHIRNQVVIDGRNFKADSDFKLDLIDRNTEICLVNDCNSTFPFTSFYNGITDDLQIRRLYKPTEVIPFQDTPKFIFTTNSVMPGEGSSDIRRRVEIEVSNYFNLNYRPSNEIGILFKWDSLEWSRFDDFIGSCIQSYLKNGLKRTKPKYLKLKRFEAITNPDFVGFANTFIEPDKLYWMDTVFKQFVNKSDDPISSHKFTKYLRAYAKYSGLFFYDEYLKSSGGRRMVIFSTQKNQNISYWKKTDMFKKMKMK